MSTRKTPLLIVVAITALGILAGCMYSPREGRMTQTATLEGQYFLLETLPDGKLLLDKEEVADLNDGRINFYVLDNKEVYPLILPDDAACVNRHR